jgi:hypothetical protein
MKNKSRTRKLPPDAVLHYQRWKTERADPPPSPTHAPCTLLVPVSPDSPRPDPPSFYSKAEWLEQVKQDTALADKYHYSIEETIRVFPYLSRVNDVEGRMVIGEQVQGVTALADTASTVGTQTEVRRQSATPPVTATGNLVIDKHLVRLAVHTFEDHDHLRRTTDISDIPYAETISASELFELNSSFERKVVQTRQLLRAARSQVLEVSLETQRQIVSQTRLHELLGGSTSSESSGVVRADGGLLARNMRAKKRAKIHARAN